MKRVLNSIVAGVLVASFAAPAVASSDDRPYGRLRSGQCTDKVDGAIPLALEVGGGRATGHYVLPATTPKGLVVFAHGYGHTSYSWIDHMVRAAREHGVVAVAMDYRGTTWSPDGDDQGTLPDNVRGWRVREGAEDSNAAALYFLGHCPSIKTTTIFGVSMGGNASGLAVAMAAETRRPGGAPLWDYWFNIEGASNVSETYNEARLVAASGNTFAKNAEEDIRAEMGGKTFEQDVPTYLDHTVVARTDDIAASGVKGAVLVHGLNDGLVPYNQSREMALQLARTQIATEMYTVGRNRTGGESGTTATGYAGVDPGLAGHASETSTTHSVMVKAFEVLWRIMDAGQAPEGYNEFFVDGDTTVPLG